MNTAVATGDWDIKHRDIDQRFARYGTHALSDEEICALSMAEMVMPDGSPGGMAYLTHVSGVDGYAERLKAWARMVADGIAGAGFMSRDGKRRRAYVEGYDKAWGHQAASDGLALALIGTHACPGIAARAEQFKCGKQGYQRIRDFVGGAAVVARVEYRCALEWALGYRRDRVFEGRWEAATGANWDDR